MVIKSAEFIFDYYRIDDVTNELVFIKEYLDSLYRYGSMQNLPTRIKYLNTCGTVILQ